MESHKKHCVPFGEVGSLHLKVTGGRSGVGSLRLNEMVEVAEQFALCYPPSLHPILWRLVASPKGAGFSRVM